MIRTEERLKTELSFLFSFYPRIFSIYSVSKEAEKSAGRIPQIHRRVSSVYFSQNERRQTAQLYRSCFFIVSDEAE